MAILNFCYFRMFRFTGKGFNQPELMHYRNPAQGDIVCFSSGLTRPGRRQMWPAGVYIHDVNDDSYFGTVAREERQDVTLAMLLNAYRDDIRMIGIVMNGPPPPLLPQIIVYDVAIYVRLDHNGVVNPAALDALRFLSDPHRLLPWMLPPHHQPYFLGGLPAANNLIIDTLGANQNLGKVRVQDESEQETDATFWP